jgi:putative SbcD/Mre11-related phosphoesterase
MKFITNEPALVIGKALVLADLHIGIEHEFRQSGIIMPSQTGKMADRMLRLVRKAGAEELIILGDVKHKVPGTSWQELREIPRLLEKLSGKVKVTIIPGNHDGGLKDIASGARITRSAGKRVGDAYLTHGHAWPGKAFLRAKLLVMGHVHPQIEFKNKLGYRWTEPVWIRAKLDRKKVSKRFREAGKLPELLVMPAFNPLSGGGTNWQKREKEQIGPVVKCADLKTAEMSMLDGTFLGKLKDLSQ